MDEEEFAVEVADAIEQCLDIESVEHIADANMIMVVTADGERFRVLVTHAKARRKHEDDDDDDEE